jgi:hypothetical protein
MFVENQWIKKGKFKIWQIMATFSQVSLAHMSKSYFLDLKKLKFSQIIIIKKLKQNWWGEKKNGFNMFVDIDDILKVIKKQMIKRKVVWWVKGLSFLVLFIKDETT